MEYRGYREREVNLIEVLWKLAFAWRQCLIVAVICAVLLPVAMYIREGGSATVADTDTQEVTQSSQEILQDLKDEEASAVEQAVLSVKDYNEAVKYLDEAPVMLVDAYDEKVQVIECFIDMNNTADYSTAGEQIYTNSVVAAYNNLITNGVVAKAIVSALGDNSGYSEAYIQELINVNSSENSSVITVEVIAPDDELRDLIVATVKDTFESNRETISRNIGAHSIRVLNEYQVNRMDSDLSDKQSAARKRITTYKSEIDTALKSMTDEQKSAFNKLVKLQGLEYSAAEETDAATAAKTSVTAFTTSSAVKYAVLGFVIGIVIVAVIILIIEIFNKKINYDTELKDLFGIETYAVFKNKQAKDYKGIDAWLFRLKYKNKRLKSEEETINSLVTNISLLMKDQEKTEGKLRLFLTGTKIDKLSDELKNKIVNELDGQGVQVEAGANVYLDNESLIKADEIGVVVIAEKMGDSVIEEVAEELNLLREHEIEVIGGVLFEG